MVRALPIILTLAAAALGCVCLIRPAAVQAYVLRTHAKTLVWKWNPLRDQVQRTGFRIYICLMGLMLLLWSVVVIYAIMSY